MTTLINHWIRHPELKRTEELLVHLYRMRMATNENLAAVMGVSLKTVKHTWIPELYSQDRDLIRSRFLKDKKKVYYLGPSGCKVVSSILGKKVNFYDYTGSQGRHFEGINNILARLVKTLGVSKFKKETEWFFTRQSRDLIQKEWAELLHEEVKVGNISNEEAVAKINELPEPDARLVIGNGKKAYWLEFDNDTESPSKLKEKLLDYAETFIPMDNHDPIVWVVTKRSPKQRDRLIQIWQEVQVSDEMEELREGYGEDFFLPQMYFFLEGQETAFLIS